MVNGEKWQYHALINRFHTIILFAVIIGFLATVGWLLLDLEGAMLLLGAGLLVVFVQPFLPLNQLMRLQGASPLKVSQAPELYAMTKELTHRAGLAW